MDDEQGQDYIKLTNNRMYLCGHCCCLCSVLVDRPSQPAMIRNDNFLTRRALD